MLTANDRSSIYPFLSDSSILLTNWFEAYHFSSKCIDERAIYPAIGGDHEKIPIYIFRQVVLWSTAWANFCVRPQSIAYSEHSSIHVGCSKFSHLFYLFYATRFLIVF